MDGIGSCGVSYQLLVGGDMMDYRESVHNAVCSARQLQSITENLEELDRIQSEATRKKEQREAENHDNIDFLAKNAQESVEILKEMNAALKENNMLLKEKNEKLESTLEQICGLLRDIFSEEIKSGEEQTELAKKTNALLCEISVAIDRGEKIDWKDKAADCGIQVVFAALGQFLMGKGII